MSYCVDRLREDIRSFRAKEALIWDRVFSHSNDYVNALRLGPSDLEALERAQGQREMSPCDEGDVRRPFLQFEAEGETVVLFVKQVCGAPYGVQSQKCVMAFCLTNSDLNMEAGQDSAHITALTDEAHERVIDVLTEDE